MFGLSPYLIIGALVAVLAAGGGGYGWGRLDAASRCRADAIQSELDTARADLRIKEAAVVEADRLAQAQRDLNRTNASVIDQLQKDLQEARDVVPETRVVTKTRTVVLRRCPLTADAARRLRDIKGDP